MLDLAEAHHDAAARGAARRARPGAPRRADRRGEHVLRRGALDVRDRPPRLPRGPGGRAARARARRAAARARRRLRADQRGGDDRGGAPAQRRRRAAGARRAPRPHLEHRPATRSPAALSATAPPGGARRRPTGAPIGVMLRSAGRPLGMLEVADEPEREFTPRDEAILAQLGQVASVAIAKTEAYTRERHIAQVLQRSLLPAGAARRSRGSARPCASSRRARGSRSAATSTTCSGSASGGVAALIGDVCGKGPEAASVTALARHTLRAAAVYERRPSAVLALLHRALREARDDGRFCTVAYGELRAGRRRRRADAARLRRAPAAARAARAAAPSSRSGKLGTLLGADVEPVLSDVEVRARGGRPARALHGRRHRGPRRPARSSSATTTSPTCSASCRGLGGRRGGPARAGRGARRGGRSAARRHRDPRRRPATAPRAAGSWHNRPR